MKLLLVKNPKSRAGGYEVDAGTIALWVGLSGTVPAGWQIYSTAGGVYIMGASAGNKNLTTQGASTHSHTNPNTSTQPDHTHGHGASVGGADSTNNGYGSANTTVAPAGHTHSVSTNGTSTGGHAHSVGNTDSKTNLTNYYRLYFIKATINTELPVGGIIWWSKNSGELITGFKVCDGNNGTPDLRGKFVYGASVDGEVGSSGGSSYHNHGAPTINSVGDHQHYVSWSVNAQGGSQGAQGTAAGTDASSAGHGHGSGGFWTDWGGSHNHSSSPTGYATPYPPYLKLWLVMRTA